jgi:nitrogen fixation protein NifM
MSEDAYLTLKVAGELYRKSPAALATSERKRVEEVAGRQRQIEKRILATPDAAQVVLPPSAIEQTLGAIRARYDSHDEFVTDLAANRLDETRLRQAVAQDLVVEAILEGVASRAGRVGDTDVEIFYLMHQDRFLKPESRSLHHILVTINDSVAGSDRGTASAKIEAIRARALESFEEFKKQALKHSECPTAMNGGFLGKIQRGKLFPELESAVFALATGETSPVLESPLGFHLVYCDGIDPERRLALDEVRDSIRNQLEEVRRAKAQKAWIAGLFRAG